jgi:tRNA threonylcarbamoyladenosine biosynthesis protein TsaE
MTDGGTVALATDGDTMAFGGRIARLSRSGDAIGLSGGLGSGKTTFARGFIRALAVADVDVPSPTFTLVQSYETPAGPVHHFDLYRLDKPDDALELGLEEALTHGITLIEWPERLGPLAPRGMLGLRFEIDGGARRALIDAPAAWQDRLPGKR